MPICARTASIRRVDDGLAVLLVAIDRLALEMDRAFVHRLEAIDATEQRRFASTGGADDADHLAARHRPRDVVACR